MRCSLLTHRTRHQSRGLQSAVLCKLTEENVAAKPPPGCRAPFQNHDGDARQDDDLSAAAEGRGWAPRQASG